MASNKRLEAWIAAFASKVEARRKREGIDYQRDLAAKLGMPQSTLSEHLGGKLKLDTVERIADLWPDEFGESVADYLKVYYGITGDGPDTVVIAEIVQALEQIQGSCANLVAMLNNYATGGGSSGAETQAEADHSDGRRGRKTKARRR